MEKEIVHKNKPNQVILIKAYTRAPGKNHKKGEVLTVTLDLYHKLLAGGYIENPDQQEKTEFLNLKSE